MLINVRHDNAKEWKILIPLLQINTELQGQTQRWTTSNAQLLHVQDAGCTLCPERGEIKHQVNLIPKSHRVAPMKQPTALDGYQMLLSRKEESTHGSPSMLGALLPTPNCSTTLPQKHPPEEPKLQTNDIITSASAWCSKNA